MTLAALDTSQTIAADRNSDRRWQFSALIFSIVFISFRPFETQMPSATPGAAQQGGDIVNQLGFGLLGIACVLLLVQYVSRRMLTAWLTPTWIAIGCALFVSVLTADYPPGAARAMIFSAIVVLATATGLALPTTRRDMVSVLIFSAAAALAMSYFAVFFVPSQGVHAGGGFEPQHAGLWRGIFTHKNVASYVMGAFVMIGLFAMRNGRPLVGFLVATLSLIFVINAGSKTVLGVLPAAIITASIARWITFAPLRVIVIVLPVAALATCTVGAVVYPPLLEKLQEFVPGLTYTGRTDLWLFSLQQLEENWLFGFGFESFWGTPRVTNLEQPIELSWDVRGIVHAHNSWLDAIINFGAPGAAIVILALTILPIRDYMRIPENSNVRGLSTLYLSIWIFCALGANLESFFFRRADPVWFCMLIAVIGLRIAAHMSPTSSKGSVPSYRSTHGR